MPNWDIALVNEQGVKFAIAVVKDQVLNNNRHSDSAVEALSLRLHQPVVLLGEGGRMYGRKDIVRFLENADLSQLPWRQVNFAS